MRLPWFKRTELAPAAREYLDSTPVKVARKCAAAELSFVVLDAEMTGFDPQKDRILSVAAVPLRGGVLQLSELKSWLVYHSEAPITDAVRVHGILPADTRGGDPEPSVLEQLLPVLRGAVLVGHHVGFDVRMLNVALHRRFRIRLRNPTLDTARLAMQVLEAFRKTGYAGQRTPSLEEVCTLLDITPLERHTAPGDTFTTAELFLVLCAKYARELGRPLTAGDLPIERA